MGYSASGFKLASLEPCGILKRKRLQLGLTQQQVADKVGIHQQQYQKFENGDRDITNSSFYTACKVIEALDMDIISFYHGKYSWDDCDDKSSQEEAGSDDMVLNASTKVNSIDYTIRVMSHNGEDYQINLLSIGLGDGSRLSDMTSQICQAQLCRPATPTQKEIENAKLKTQSILDRLDIGKFVVTKATVRSENWSDLPEYSIRVDAAPVFEDIPVLLSQKSPYNLSEDAYAYSYPLTQAFFIFNANGSLIGCNISSPVDEKSVLNTNVQTLSISELLEKAQNHLALYDSSSLVGLNDNFLMSGLSAKNYCCKVEITDAEYGLGRIPKENSEKTYLYIPAILFNGTVDYYDKETGKMLVGPYGNQIQTLVTVNALDGSII